MPIYAYQCRECDERFEQFRAISASDDQVTCPRCGTKKPKRLISIVFSQGFNDSGRYVRPT